MPASDEHDDIAGAVESAPASLSGPRRSSVPADGTVTISEKSVGNVVSLNKQLEPTQQAGMLLAAGVGVVTTVAILAIIAAWFAKAPWMGVPPGLGQMDQTRAKDIIGQPENP